MVAEGAFFNHVVRSHGLQIATFPGVEHGRHGAGQGRDFGARGGAAGDGNVIAFGDFTFLSSPYESYADNAALIGNLADFGLSGKQKITLNNFPFLYSTKTVQVYLSSDLSKTAEMVAALGRLQAALQSMNVTVEFVDSVPTNGDAIILGLFTPNEDLAPSFNKFDLTLEDGSELITGYVQSFIPGAHALRSDDPAQLESVAAAFGASYSVTTAADGQIDVSHSAGMYVVDPSGTVVLTWPFGIPADGIATDLEILFDRSAK